MIVVSDTSPLNYLVLVGQVELLPKLFDRIIVPPAVLRELQHAGAPGSVRAWADMPPAWAETFRPEAPLEIAGLGDGE